MHNVRRPFTRDLWHSPARAGIVLGYADFLPGDISMRRVLLAGLIAFCVLPAAAVTPPATSPLDMETIMANPDWIGHAVESPYWSADGHNLYYSVQRDGSPVRDLYRVDPASGNSVKLDPAAMARADGPAVFDRAHRHAAYILHGDVFVVDLASGQRRQRLVSLRPGQRGDRAGGRAEACRRPAGETARRAGRAAIEPVQDAARDQ